MATVIPGSVQSNRDRAELVALRRLGTVEDCAKVVEFLATDLSDYVTGSGHPDRWRAGSGVNPLARLGHDLGIGRYEMRPLDGWRLAHRAAGCTTANEHAAPRVAPEPGFVCRWQRTRRREASVRRSKER